MGRYTVFLQPISDTYYTYEVEAQDESEAQGQAFDLLQDAIGWDASKDWECFHITEERDNG